MSDENYNVLSKYKNKTNLILSTLDQQQNLKKLVTVMNF